MDSGITKRAVIYCRVSTQDQVQNTSLAAQEKACRAFVSQKGLRTAGVFVDEGESAKTADRPEFQKAIAFAIDKKNQVQFFVVYKLDRFSRKMEDHIAVYTALKRGGVALQSATEPIDETPVGKLMRNITGAVAEFDNDQRADRTKNGMTERAEAGVWVWPTPTGYYRPTHSKNIAPEPEAAPLIKKAFEEYARGIYTYKSLAALLASLGLKTSEGKSPSAQWVDKTLHNPLYSGWIVIEKWNLKVKGAFEAIVDEELFSRCQRKSAGAQVHGSPRTKSNPEFPLRKLVICSKCKMPLTGSSSTGRKGKKYPYYHHHVETCESSASIPKETLEQLFIGYLEDVNPDEKFERLFREIVFDVWKESFRNLGHENQSIRKSLATLENERQQIFTLHRMKVYSDSDFLDQKNFVDEKIASKKRLLEENDVVELDMDRALNNCFQYVRETCETWVHGTLEERLGLQKAVFASSLEFDGQKFGNTKLTLIYRLKQEYAGEKSRLVALVKENWNPLIIGLKAWTNYSKLRGWAE